MAQVEIADGRLVLRLDRSDRLWAFRSQLEVPLAHVRGVEVDPQRVRVPWSGLPIRDPGSWAPGVLAAGSVRQEGEWAFWDVRDPERAVIIHLDDERFARLVVEVDDPAATAAAIRQAIDGGGGRDTVG
jgi:hypothetical protein